MPFANRAVPIVLAAVLIDSIGFGIVMPVLPSLITRLGHVGIDDATRIAGYMLTAFALTQFFAGPVLGNLSDRYGRRLVLIASMLAFGVDYALMALAPTLAWLFVGRAIAGAAGAIYGPASSVIADVVPVEKRSAAFGYISGAFGIGFVLGPALGGVLAALGPRAPFAAAAALALGNAAVMAFAMPESLQREHRRPFRWRDAHVIGAFRPLFDSPIAVPLLVVALLWQIANTVYPGTWAFWATIRFHWSPGAIGLSLTYVGFIMAAVQVLLVGSAIARLGDRRALMVGLVCAIAGFLAFAFIQAGWQVYAIMLLASLQGFVGPAISGLLSRMVGPERQGALQGGLGSLGSVAAIVSPLLMTQALAAGVELGFPGAAFVLAAVLALAALGVVVWKVLDRAPPAPAAVAEA
ncbi:MFS transporter [Sphingomonas sp. PAMC 26605]|uniref:MFS transporter n=1 Tax=Sphingomonas sp. PAMC 26605 TaxID=1112214 RepID=UPI00026CD1C9|nr:MFS transporter [Sphingomonas sp. PAMC 26605]